MRLVDRNAHIDSLTTRPTGPSTWLNSRKSHLASNATCIVSYRTHLMCTSVLYRSVISEFIIDGYHYQVLFENRFDPLVGKERIRTRNFLGPSRILCRAFTDVSSLFINSFILTYFTIDCNVFLV